jgi:cytochrome c biogenesis protein
MSRKKLRRTVDNPYRKTTNVIWRFFTSIRLTIVLLTLIIVASILGTVIPQQEAANAFAHRLSPGLTAALYALHLFDIFHSPWFLILVIVFSFNLIVCSLDRFPRSWKLSRKSMSPDHPDVFENLPSHRVVSGNRSLQEAARDAELLLRKHYRRVRRKDTDDEVFISGDKGIVSHFGAYVVHLGVLILLGGVIVGALFGFNAYLEVAEGSASNSVHLKGKGGIYKLDFSVRCDRFFHDFYADGSPKTYRSDLSFLKDGHVVYEKPVLVNHPVTFEGIRFYQSNYGLMPADKAVLIVKKGVDEKVSVTVQEGMKFNLPGTTVKGDILRIEHNLMKMGPAVKVSIQTPGGDMLFWIFQKIEQIEKDNPGLLEQFPLLNPKRFKPYIFALERIHKKYYTGLQVNRDPGVPFVAAGSVFIVLGFILVFFCSHRQLWIKIDEDGAETRICVYGKSKKDPVGLSREIKRIIHEIHKAERNS